MFRDEDELVKEQIRRTFTIYDLTSILEDNDLDEVDAIFYLYINGYIKLPEVQPL